MWVLGLERDSNCNIVAISLLTETFARQLSNKAADLTSSGDVLSTSNNLVDALDSGTAKKLANVCAVLKTLGALQTSPKHISDLIRCMRWMTGGFKNAVVFLCRNGARKWYGRSRQMEACALLEMETCDLSVAIKNKGIFIQCSVGVVFSERFWYR